MDKAEFQKKYVETFKNMMKYSLKEAGAEIYCNRLADLYDQHPDWADEAEAVAK